MNKREQQRLETRRRIYECAIRLFKGKTYDTVKITDIVKAAHVSVGAFYYHFPSKENLIDEGYRCFDEELESEWEADDPKPGVEAIEYLTNKQLKDVEHKGVEVTGIFFKSQIGNSNTYLFRKDRFFYRKMYENVELVNHTEVPSGEIVDSLLRASRGTIYDWCLHNGKYDVRSVGIQDLRIQLKYYGIMK
ncbi:MAG: TetR/AcrR family transcriptional regulator [Eubacteriaceae bacterium]|nr:TetR/AcrR family transcriptional regulator [Eubacteriaceae bacterium]